MILHHHVVELLLRKGLTIPIDFDVLFDESISQPFEHHITGWFVFQNAKAIEQAARGWKCFLMVGRVDGNSRPAPDDTPAKAMPDERFIENTAIDLGSQHIVKSQYGMV